jgi:site-specific recombinase XerD
LTCGEGLAAVESVHIATYIEQLSQARSAPTAKLRVAALRHLFDWMVIGQIMPTNPAAAVPGLVISSGAARRLCWTRPRRVSFSTRSTP